jgi:hypothetical protein
MQLRQCDGDESAHWRVLIIRRMRYTVRTTTLLAKMTTSQNRPDQCTASDVAA